MIYCHFQYHEVFSWLKFDENTIFTSFKSERNVAPRLYHAPISVFACYQDDKLYFLDNNFSHEALLVIGRGHFVTFI